jgi:hypothetical protein
MSGRLTVYNERKVLSPHPYRLPDIHTVRIKATYSTYRMYVYTVRYRTVQHGPKNSFIQLPGNVRCSHDEDSVLCRGSGAVYLGHELCFQAS